LATTCNYIYFSAQKRFVTLGFGYMNSRSYCADIS